MDFLIHHMLRNSAAMSPNKEALVHGDGRLSYRELQQRTAGLAQGLRQAGVRRCDRVGILLDPSVPQVLSILAVPQAGGVFVPMHHSLQVKQVSHIVNDCEMRGLIVEASRLNALSGLFDLCPCLEFVVVVRDADSVEVPVKRFDFDELCQTTADSPWREVAIEKDLGAILYTSGSTGKPKGVMLSHANVIAGASIVSEYLKITAEDRILAALPFSFDAGLNQLTTALQQGGTLVLVNFRFGKQITEMLVKEKITGLAGVPPLWSLLAQPSSGLAKADTSRLRYITNTGGAMPTSLLAQLREALPETEVVLMYGLTEAFRSTYLPPAELDDRPTSMGKAIPNTDIFVVNENNELCAPGEVGQLVHHGPTVSMGYWGHPELTNKVLRPHPFAQAGQAEPPKVCYSGDLVKMDEDGFLYFVGRGDNLIKTSGFRVSSTEIEEVLCDVGNLQAAAVVGIPDEALGQRIKAFVVPGENSTVDPDELRAWCANVMPRHMVPSAIELLSEMPKTTSGKIDYKTLREWALKA